MECIISGIVNSREFLPLLSDLAADNRIESDRIFVTLRLGASRGSCDSDAPEPGRGPVQVAMILER